MEPINKFSKVVGDLRSIISDIAKFKETQVKVNFTEEGPVVNRDSSAQPVPNVKSEEISSPMATLDPLTAKLLARFEGEVRDLKKVIEGGNTLSDLCTAIGKQPLPPHLQEAKERLLATLIDSLEQSSHKKLKETLEQARDDPNDAKALTKSILSSYPHARWAKVEILRSISSLLEQKLAHVDPQVKAKIVSSVVIQAELALETAEKMFHDEMGERFAAHLAEHVTIGDSLPETVESCRAATQQFLEQSEQDPSPQDAIEAFQLFSDKAAEGVLAQLSLEPHETMSQEEISKITTQVLAEIEKESGQKFFWNANDALREGISLSDKENEDEAEEFTKALQTYLHKKAQHELNCSKEDFREALQACKNEEEIALVVGKILVEVTDRADNALYEHTLGLLEEVYPDIKKYCLDKDKDHRLLSPKGIEVMLEVLKQKGRLHGVPVHLCLVPEQAIVHLEQLAKAAPEEKMGLILRHDTNPLDPDSGQEIHYFAVMAEKTAQGLRIAITDSFSSRYYRDDLVDGLEERFTQQGIACKILLPKIEIDPKTYREVSFQRQSDFHSCAIFAMRDISQFCQHPEILDEIEKHAPVPVEDSSLVQFVPFERMPKALMKATQSLTKIAAYDDQNVSEDLRKAGKINPLSVKDQPGVIKDVNTLIMDRNRKYERIMIAAAIHRGLAKQNE